MYTLYVFYITHKKTRTYLVQCVETGWLCVGSSSRWISEDLAVSWYFSYEYRMLQFNWKDFISIVSTQHFCVVWGAGGVLEGSIALGVRIRGAGRSGRVSVALAEGEKEKGQTSRQRKGNVWPGVKEQVGVCEGCPVTPGLGNASPERTNALSLAGFTCYVSSLVPCRFPGSSAMCICGSHNNWTSVCTQIILLTATLIIPDVGKHEETWSQGSLLALSSGGLPRDLG